LEKYLKGHHFDIGTGAAAQYLTTNKWGINQKDSYKPYKVP